MKMALYKKRPNDKEGQNITMYLGDSENDNPAFRKAGLSIGIRSDTRLNPRLDSDYTMSFDKLGSFIERLLNNGFNFRQDMVVDY
jgi:phosphoserine phosphatase